MKGQIPHTKYEKKLLKQGYKVIAGVDEAGRGSWAGPVVAAAVILDLSFFKSKNRKIKGVKDSKKLTVKNREKIYKKIIDSCLYFGIGVVSHIEVDKIGISRASRKAMEIAVSRLKICPDYLLIDAFETKSSLPQKGVKKGDEVCYSISCASIIAKVTRDNLMVDLHNLYPEYGFDRHKGYGTKKHQEALKRYGVSDIHRRSYKPIKELI